MLHLQHCSGEERNELESRLIVFLGCAYMGYDFLSYMEIVSSFPMKWILRNGMVNNGLIIH